MDYNKIINLVLDNKANVLNSTSRDLLTTLKIAIELELENLNEQITELQNAQPVKPEAAIETPIEGPEFVEQRGSFITEIEDKAREMIATYKDEAREKALFYANNWIKEINLYQDKAVNRPFMHNKNGIG